MSTIYLLLEHSLINQLLLLIFVIIILLFRHKESFKFIIIICLFTGIMIFGFLHFFLVYPSTTLQLMFLRIIGISFVYLLFYSEISPENLAKALISFKVPYQYAWTISTAFRYIFLLANDSKEIKNALLVRGVPLDGNLFERIKNIPFVINLLLFRTNYQTMKFSEALFAKNWTPYGTKTWLYPLNLKQKQNAIVGFLLIGVVLNLSLMLFSIV